MNYRIQLFFTIIGLMFIYSCSASKPFYASSDLEKAADKQNYQNADTLHTFFLIGDTGDPKLEKQDPVLSTFQHHLEESPHNSSAIFLGDNIYSSGMPANPQHSKRQLTEDKMSVALDALKQISHRAYFIPGNHDWRYGQDGLRAQEKFIENYPDINAAMEPSFGCPGPYYTVIEDQWLMIALDSDWLVKHGQLAETDLSRCDFSTHDEVMAEVERVVDNHPDKQLLVATHHPLYSNGPHGGYYTLKDHIFPLTNLKSWMYLPMPILGTVYPVYRKIGNSSQDIPNKTYQRYKSDLLEATSRAQTRLFASGHEHSLAFFDLGDHSSIVSGSGSKKSFAKKGEGADFVYSEKGFAKLLSFSNGDLAIEFWVPSKENQAGRRVFSKRIKIDIKITEQDPDYDVSVDVDYQESRQIAPGPGYGAGVLKRAIWGSHYREVWTTPVEIPAIDLTKYNVLSVGGGQQSVSIVVEDSTGRRGIMRSIQKDPSEALPEILRETFANDIIQDQISAAHPYGALVVAALAEAAGVYQTEPELGFIPKSSGLSLPGNVDAAPVLLEEFVSAEWFRDQTDKTVTDVLSTNEVWAKSRETYNFRVNQEQLLRSRLFDMFIGDWDRHDGQWFWAEVESDDGFLFEPVPIDRDNAFFTSDGLVPRLASRKWALRKFQHFDNDIRDIKGINFNAMHLDRWFLTEPERDVWLRIARDLEIAMTDRVIDNAVQTMPEEAFELSGAEIAGKLKARRTKLREFAERYYDVLSIEVNVFGSNQPDRFDIERLQNGDVRVVLTDMNSSAIRYERLFRTEETDEIRLYGFNSDDHFELTGPDHSGILIRLIPGEGTDILEDQFSTASSRTNVIVYDTFNGLQSNIRRATNINYSNDRKVHRYNREAFQYDLTAPLITGGFNADDGVFLGGGIRFVRHGFRKAPYARMHEISVKHSLLTSAFSFRSSNSFTEAIGSLDFNIDLDVLAPNFRANYFGLGNETERIVDDRSFYRFRMDQVHLKASLQKRISSITRFMIGPEYAFFSPSETSGRFISSAEAGLNPDDFQGHHFGVIASSFQINSVDNEAFPYYGFRFRTDASLNMGLDDKSDSFVRLGTEGTLYYTLEKLTSTIGFRIGAETNIGDFNFFRANTLGGNTLLGDHGRLRGFMRDRFAGRTAFYHNLDLRSRLFDFQSYLFPASVGIIGFFDNGRVWLDDQNSDRWHQGYGGGVWISPFRRAVLTATYSLSDEDELFSINLGFNF